MGECRENKLSLIEHIRELRSRIVWVLGAVICTSVFSYWFYNDILNMLYRPFKVLENDHGSALYVTSLFEGFIVRLKISLLAGIILALPIILYHVIKFIVPALYSSEKQFLAWWLVAAGILVIGGVLYSYYGIVPLCVKFMTGSEFVPSQIGLLLNFEQNIFYILRFILIISLVFQLPIILLALMAMNLLHRKTLLKSGRYIICLFFVVGAIITPPDVVSQTAVAFPLIVLFYLSIGIAKFFNWGESH